MAPRTRVDKDYYRVLSVAVEATEDEIRRAYRRQALQWHPDRNPGRADTGERFKEISEAYAVLIDPRKRREYDHARQAGRPADFRPAREDLFRDLFSDPRASAVFEELVQEFERMGVRVHRQEFQDVLFGGRTVVTSRVVVVAPFSPLVAVAKIARALLFGGATQPRPTAAPARPSVMGSVARLGRRLLGLEPTGEIPAGADAVMPLTITSGEATRGARKRITLRTDGRAEDVLVKVPAGVRPGTRLRLRGKGRAAPDGGRGDLYLAVEIVEGW
jgi:DnaJ-class molecular chaperone